MKKQKAFTLAEVLIVMGIIGVLAILTVPNMLSNVDANKRSTSFKKAFSTLNNVYASYFIGDIQRPRAATARNGNNLLLALTEKLNIDRYYTLNDTTGAVTPSYEAPVTVGQASTDAFDTAHYTDLWVKTTDGMAYQVVLGQNNCLTRLAANNLGTLADAIGATGTCMWVVVDYNSEKAPNIHCATGGGITEGEAITDDQLKGMANCDRITFLLTQEGFTAGNPDHTVAGRLLGKD